MPPVVLPPPSTETPSAGECKAPAADPSKPVAQKGLLDHFFVPASSGQQADPRTDNERAKATAAAKAEQDTEEGVANFRIYPNGGERRSPWHARMDKETRLLVKEKPERLASGNADWLRIEASRRAEEGGYAEVEAFQLQKPSRSKAAVAARQEAKEQAAKEQAANGGTGSFDTWQYGGVPVLTRV